MNSVIPWKIIFNAISPYYIESHTGRPKSDLELLIRAFCLSQWFNLSDEGLEDAIYDRYSFQQFLGIDLLTDKIPDHTVYCRFRTFLHENKLGDKVFAEVNKYLEGKRLLMREGTLVDATIISAPSSTKNEGKTRTEGMRSTKKGGQWYFGMKAHIGQDCDNGVVHSAILTPANVADISEVANLLHGKESLFGGDKAYESKELEAYCEKNNIEYAVLKKKKANETSEEKTEREKLNNLKASIRARVEWPFRIIKCLFGQRKARFRGIEKNASWFMWTFTLVNVYVVRRSLLTA